MLPPTVVVSVNGVATATTSSGNRAAVGLVCTASAATSTPTTTAAASARQTRRIGRLRPLSGTDTVAMFLPGSGLLPCGRGQVPADYAQTQM